MKYYKYADNGYIVCIGTGGMGEEISEAEYNELKAVIDAKPSRWETTDYRLREDLTWEEYELEPLEEPEPTAEDKAEAYDILMGGAT